MLCLCNIFGCVILLIDNIFIDKDKEKIASSVQIGCQKYIKPVHGFPTSYAMLFVCVFSELRWEVIVRFVDIVGIVGQHCLIFLVIKEPFQLYDQIRVRKQKLLDYDYQRSYIVWSRLPVAFGICHFKHPLSNKILILLYLNKWITQDFELSDHYM